MTDGIERQIRVGIPSTGIIKFLDYFESLTPAEQPRLLDALAQVGALCFLPPPQMVKAYEELRTANASLLQMAAGFQDPRFAYGLRYEGLRMTKAMLNDAESVAHFSGSEQRSTLSPAMIRRRSSSKKETYATSPLRRHRCFGNC